mmetsp:Transcript_8831/g.25157  ORF Transcript_8831/g.25157 Transcript_8831/m.25157 type:complete len:484 (-) Transcript_8831:446-1897(-)
MPHITRALLRKRAEHNEGMISTLEELSLHQEELESISDVLGTTCRKLKILYLQNNIIPRMENLHHMKELEYLNLALNNIEKIEGLDRCEFINKLDLTVNFIDFDALEASIDHLSSRRHLRELFLMGNPSQMDWDGFSDYIIYRLPQLRQLDGKEISRSMRIIAAQHFPRLEAELREKAAACRERKAQEAAAKADAGGNPGGAQAMEADGREGGADAGEEEDEDDSVPHTPEARTEMYREIAEEKAAKDAKEKERMPKERDYEKEQAEAIERTRRMEEEGRIRQCNEGKWGFSFDEETKKGCVVLDVAVPRHMDSSLIDVDIHPTYASVVIKSKVLRLSLPAEVKVGESKAQRSKTTGHLVLIMPKVKPEENEISVRVAARERQKKAEEAQQKQEEAATAREQRNLAMQAQQEASKAVKLKGLVRPSQGGLRPEPEALRAVSTIKKTVQPPPPPAHLGSKSVAGAASGSQEGDESEDDEPPPPM